MNTSLPDRLPSLGRWLCLAAAPTFAAAALYTAFGGDPVADALCRAGASGSHAGGMVAMYAWMSLFHLTPWLRLSDRSGITRSAPR